MSTLCLSLDRADDASLGCCWRSFDVELKTVQCPADGWNVVFESFSAAVWGDHAPLGFSQQLTSFHAACPCRYSQWRRTVNERHGTLILSSFHKQCQCNARTVSARYVWFIGERWYDRPPWIEHTTHDSSNHQRVGQTNRQTDNRRDTRHSHVSQMFSFQLYLSFMRSS